MADLGSYETFLASKHLRDDWHGFDVAPVALHPRPFPFQQEIIRWALKKGRAALFLDTGLGKTLIQLEWARHVAAYTGRKVLILTPLAVAHQFVREAAAMDLQAAYCRSQDQADASDAAVIITNYEMLKAFDPAAFAGVSLDESSILKNFTGKTRVELTNAFRDTPFRLCATATPAPNDYLELGNHADFLGVMPANEMIMRWFINDTMQAGNYRLKGHAARDYWRWVASWAACVSKPSDLGYPDDGYELPPLSIHQHRVEVDHTRAWESGHLFLSSALSATALWKDKRATAAARCLQVASIVNARPDVSWAVWCDTNDEADILLSLLPAADTVEVRGSQSVAEKERKLVAFATGEKRIIITKADITAFGVNWQHCSHTALTGVTYSMERMYQLLRRFYRFGQRSEVHAHIVVAETEDDVLATVRHKEEQHRAMQAAMTAAMREVGLLANKREHLIGYNPQVPMTLPTWLRSKAA